MKFIILLILFFPYTFAQWTYLAGNQSLDSNPDYLSQYPGGIHEHTMAVRNFNLYIFGGSGHSGGSTSMGALNNLWKFDISGNTWELVSGSMNLTTSPDYITPYPGGLHQHSMCIYNGNIYIFGGRGNILSASGTF